MSEALAHLHVLALDCQASGATPAHGDLLELGWAQSGPEGLVGAAYCEWIVPRSERRVPRAIRELTGWSEPCLALSVPEQEAWQALLAHSATLATPERGAPCVIHFARFELTFLHDLHARLSPDLPFPLDVVCMHEIAARLFPDLPRRNIRALAGHLGHSPELMRRAAGHVLASTFIWRALVPRLGERGVETWSALKQWLAEAPRPARPAKRRYPLAPERRRALPDKPGVYRFVRSNRDVVYVGKAASLKARVASHFAGHARATERALEMLTQVDDIDYTETPSILEAALLECDEIKRLDPPYNIHLRVVDRATWFASRDLRDLSPAPDAEHRVGPLPSRYAAAPFVGLVELLEGAPPDRRNCAQVLGVPAAFLPDDALFREGFALFEAEHMPASDSAARRVERAARALWLLRGRREPESADEDAPPDAWDLARVRRRLERNLIQAGLSLRRARWLCLLADADVIYRERKMEAARALCLTTGSIGERLTLDPGAGLDRLSPRTPSPRAARQQAFDIATYDRLRVLATELRRVLDEGGEVSVRVGSHALTGARLAQLTRAV